MKLFSKIATAFVGIAMAVGVGVAVSSSKAETVNQVSASEEVAYTLSGSIAGTGNSYTGNNSATQDGVSWIVNGNVTMNPWRIGNGKSGSAGTRKVQSQAAVSPQNITKIVINTSNVGITPSEITLKVGISAGDSSITNTTTTWETPTKTITRPDGANWTGRFFEIGFTIDATASKYFCLTSIVFYYESSTPVETYSVTYTAGTNGSGSYEHTSQPAGSYALLSFSSLTGVSADSGYRFKNYTVNGVDKNAGETITISGATSVTVNFEVQPLEASYDFVTNFGTYASEWGGYGPKSVKGTDLGSSYEASITFTYASKQSGTITDRPVIAAKDGNASTMTVVLDSSVSSSYVITYVDVAFKQWSTSKKVAASLYKGTTASGDVLDSFAQTETPRDLEVTYLNGDSITVDFTSTETGNQQLGITSVTFGLAAKAAYGTTDHIKVTASPRTIYHVGEEFDLAGLQVTAYDDADESIANYKDVTSSITTLFSSDWPQRSGYTVLEGYDFEDGDVPGGHIEVRFEENASNYSDYIQYSIYAIATYELVTEEPTDWSGNYLIVSSYTDSEEVEHTVALNSALTNFDQEGNFIEVTNNTSNINAGQEGEFSVATYNSGYSMRGKNGKYAYGSSSNRFETSSEPKELSFAFDSTTHIATITGGNDYLLCFKSASSRFGFYDPSKNSANVYLYKLVGSANADAYAQTFLGAFTCDSTGENAPTFNEKEPGVDWSWSLLKTEYNTLSNAEKEEFRLGVPSSEPSASNISKAVARYDYVVAKYGYENFMSRTVTPHRNIGQTSVDSNTTNTAIIVVTVIAVVSVSSIGVLLVLKRRKNHI